MGILSLLGGLITPLIQFTISMSIAFVVLIWFTLSLIFAITTIINFLLGQPFIGWLITGDINASNDLQFLFKNGLFSFNAPLMIFLYVGLGISVFMFLIYFVFAIMPFNIKNTGSISNQLIGISIIILSIIWIPFLYSLLIIATSGLMVVLNSLLNINNSESLGSQINLFDLKNKTITQLNQIKYLKNQLGFNQIDIESDVIKNLISPWTQENKGYFFFFSELWNKNFSDTNLNIETIDKWINILNSINLDDLSSLTKEQIEGLKDIYKISLDLNLMNEYYDQFSFLIHDLEKFNNIFFVLKNNSEIDLKTFILKTELLDLRFLDKNYKLNDFIFILLNNKNIFSNNFGQSLVNILYSLALGENSVFVPGWGNSGIGDSLNIIMQIPNSIKSIGLNLTVNLFYNIKMLAIGGIINSILLSGFLVFALILLKRFLYIAFWPIMILFRAARSGSGDLGLIKDGVNQLFYKFLSIIIFALMWNFISVLTTGIFQGIDKMTDWKVDYWIIEVLKLFVIIGLIWGSFILIKEFLEIMEQDRLLANAGASEVASAKSKAENQASKITKDWKSAKASGSKKIDPIKKNVKENWSSTKGQGNILTRFNVAAKMAKGTKGTK